MPGVGKCASEGVPICSGWGTPLLHPRWRARAPGDRVRGELDEFTPHAYPSPCNVRSSDSGQSEG